MNKLNCILSRLISTVRLVMSLFILVIAKRNQIVITWRTGKNVFTYAADFEDHIINVQGIVRMKNKGVVGGHNRENFEKAFTDEGWDLEDCIIYERNHHCIDGITEVKYGIPTLDREGSNIIVDEMKSIPKPKTVYDPQKISYADIIKWGKEAMENGDIDETTGKVTNVFPIVARDE